MADENKRQKEVADTAGESSAPQDPGVPLSRDASVRGMQKNISGQVENRLQNDIQKILSEVKLPERKARRETGKENLTFDTKVASVLSDVDVTPKDALRPSNTAAKMQSPVVSVPQSSKSSMSSSTTQPAVTRPQSLPKTPPPRPSRPPFSGRETPQRPIPPQQPQQHPQSQSSLSKPISAQLPKTFAQPAAISIRPTTPQPAKDGVPVPPAQSIRGGSDILSAARPPVPPLAKPLPTPPPSSPVSSIKPSMPPVSTPLQNTETLKKIVVPPSSRQETKAPDALPKVGAAISSLHTLKDDLQGIVREKKVSLVRAVALEEDKKHKRDEAVAAAPKRSLSSQKTLSIALAFIVLGLFALLGVYVVMRSQATHSEPVPSAVIFAEQTISLELNNQPFGEVKRNLAALRSFTQLTLGAITRVMPVVSIEQDGVTEERPATLAEFMNALGIPAPNDLTRALGDEFFFGVHVVDENAPLVVAPVTSYERAFAAMLAWEKNMNANLAPIFTPVSPFLYDANGLLVERPFEDLVIRNYDVRALRDDGGTIQLYYSFPTRNILVIAESTYSFTEILSRLRAERRL